LKKVKFSLNMFKARNDAINKTDKRHALVYDTMTKLFLLGISKFPDDIYMRIAYSMYTLRILKSKQ
jgi:predicted transcriptional regulator